jgi:acetyl esterase/lipase
MRWSQICATAALTLCVTSLSAQENSRSRAKLEYPPKMAADRVQVYKTVGNVSLNLYLFNPAGHAASDKRPAVVFFFGGGWSGGSPKQFEKQCQYLASRGLVAIAVDYRVALRHQVKAVSCVADAKSAIRWVRANAGRLGIDPEKIVAAGGSAGGHLAACTALIEGFDEPNEAQNVSSRPNALVLFNPALVLAPVNGELPLRNPAQLAERMGTEPKGISPYHHIRAAGPPTLILHGKEDAIVPYKTAEWFAEAMTKAGNRCELVGYENENHGFFNHGKSNNRPFAETLARADRFLASLGYLTGEPNVDAFLATQMSSDKSTPSPRP